MKLLPKVNSPLKHFLLIFRAIFQRGFDCAKDFVFPQGYFDAHSFVTRMSALANIYAKTGRHLGHKHVTQHEAAQHEGGAALSFPGQHATITLCELIELRPQLIKRSNSIKMLARSLNFPSWVLCQ